MSGRIRALIVAFTVLAVAFCAGRFSLPVFYAVFADPKTFHWSHAVTAGGGSVVLLLGGVLGPLVGWLGDRYSPKAVILAGCIASAAAMALLSTTQTQVQWYTFCTLLGVGLAASSLVPASMLIAPWFTKQRGLAVGVINAGVGLGGYVFPKVTTKLIGEDGYAHAFWVLSLAFAIPLVVTLLFTPKPPAGAPHRGSHTLANTEGLLSNPVFWIFGIALFFSAHTLTGVQEHLVLYLRGQGVKPPDAAQALSTLLGASALGKLLGGAVADWFSSRASMLLATLFLILGCCGLLITDPKSATIYVVAAIFGLGFGGIFNAPSLIAFEYWRAERMGTILGLFMMFFGLGTSSGGLVAGAIFDQTHRYAAAYGGPAILRFGDGSILCSRPQVKPCSNSSGIGGQESRLNLILEGNCWKFGHNIPTDMITPTHLVMRGMSEMVKHVLENANPDFPKNVQQGDIIVAGRNFGCSSGRAIAPKAIKATGVGAVIAEFFSRTFYRNGPEIGLPILETRGIHDLVETGHRLRVDIERGTVENLTTGASIQGVPPSGILLDMLRAGGLIPLLKSDAGRSWIEAS